MTKERHLSRWIFLSEDHKKTICQDEMILIANCRGSKKNNSWRKLTMTKKTPNYSDCFYDDLARKKCERNQSVPGKAVRTMKVS